MLTALASVYADERLEMSQCDKPTGKKATVKFLYPELAKLARKLRKPTTQAIGGDPDFKTKRASVTDVVNRLWQKFLGRGLVEPVDDMEQKAWSPDLLDWLAQDLANNGYDLKHTMKVIMTSRAYQMPSVSMDEQPHVDFVFAGPAVRRLSAEQFRDSLGALTGVWFETAAFQPPVIRSEKAAETNPMPKGAKWIWSEPGAEKQAPAEWVYFRKPSNWRRCRRKQWR